MTGNSADSDMDRSLWKPYRNWRLMTLNTGILFQSGKVGWIMGSPSLNHWRLWSILLWTCLSGFCKDHDFERFFVTWLWSSKSKSVLFLSSWCFCPNLLSIPRKGRNRQHRATPRPSLESKFLELPQIRRAGPRAQGIVFFHLVT